MQTSSSQRIDIPESLRHQILAFRKRVWTVKLIEAVAGAFIGILIGFLAIYALDRVIDTPTLVRAAIFTVAMVVCMAIPLAIDKWVLRRRRLDQLARLLTHDHPDIGDRLLGIIELSQNDSEQARSPVLVEAAIRQVAALAEQQDLEHAVPNPRHKQRAWTAAALALMACVITVATTAAASNAWKRYLLPWTDTPRYTFAAVEEIPETIYVPHGESFTIPVQLREDTEWKPESGEISLTGLDPVRSGLQDNKYIFELPGQIQSGKLDFRIGDYLGESRIEPKVRPELIDLTAEVELPAYLQRTEPLKKNVRSGTVSAVSGSKTRLHATISRDLKSATVDRHPVKADGPRLSTQPVSVEKPRKLEIDWNDEFGLSGRKPFVVEVNPMEDESPSLICEGLPRKKVVLDSEMIKFDVKARDDFGVKRVGIEWKGLNPELVSPAKGEKMLGAGNPDAELLELAGAFSAKQLEIEPQPIEVRVFAEDYLPNRERAYSHSCILFVLDPEQHAIWVTSQLSRWHRMALDVRDRELRLYETNKQLRELSPEQLDQPDIRKQLEAQASAEKANGRRLSGLVNSGEELLKQAMRNPEIGVGHLDRWAEMMQLLKDISGNRMPSVAELLKEASKSQQMAQASQSNNGKQAGQNRANVSGGDPKKAGNQKKQPDSKVPTITDVESTRNEIKSDSDKEPTESNPKKPSLRLPTTMLAGNAKSDKKPKSPTEKKVDEAVKEQEDLLAEFEKIADELNEILANLEGSTLVKRLKAASRRQEQVAKKLGTLVSQAFGASKLNKQHHSETFQQLADAETDSSQTVSYIMDDMSAYFERSRFMRFKVVLDEMREEQVVGELRNLSDDLREENGLSISQAEYWSESLDRWAENLVDVSKCGACPGCKSKGSLPPSIVLEVLQILEGEINLREQTRVAEQAKAAVSDDEHQREAGKLSETQDVLRDRIDKVVVRIKELPDSLSDFGKEIRLLNTVSGVMSEATDILARPETGSPAIAAETEAIELLLQSKRFNPNGGGGGGANPGGGGGGDTQDTALALVGSGVNEKEVREDPETVQSTGYIGDVLPEEFRAGLDKYFNSIDRQ
ncbi:MAG: hypothetical protein HUJ26_07300 [Planctomycetaceae bacterium]|nr:hypothetical protein [Planctomycetaceae bacterium]